MNNLATSHKTFGLYQGLTPSIFFLALLGILANMPGSADQFSRPSGMGELGTIQNDNNLKGMTIHTRKECH